MLREYILDDYPSIKKIYHFITTILLGISNILLFAIIYYHNGIIDSQSKNIIYDLSTSIYFSIITWTTLGYGDFIPTEQSRIFASIEALLGYIYTAILIGLFLNSTKHKR